MRVIKLQDGFHVYYGMSPVAGPFKTVYDAQTAYPTAVY